jgi:hypothetical protein
VVTRWWRPYTFSLPLFLTTRMEVPRFCAEHFVLARRKADNIHRVK